MRISLERSTLVHGLLNGEYLVAGERATRVAIVGNERTVQSVRPEGVGIVSATTTRLQNTTAPKAFKALWKAWAALEAGVQPAYSGLR